MSWNSTSQSGARSELKAALYFIEQGHQVFTPLVPNDVEDFIVKSRKSGRLLRVQVKTVHHTATGGGGDVYSGAPVTRSRGRHYSLDEVDYFVLVGDGQDLWVIPAEVIINANIPKVVLGRRDGKPHDPVKQPDWSAYKVR